MQDPLESKHRMIFDGAIRNQSEQRNYHQPSDISHQM